MDLTSVKRFVQKAESRHPWYGTRNDLAKLASLAEQIFQIEVERRRRAITDDRNLDEAGKSYALTFTRPRSLEFVVFEPGSSLTGSIDDVVAAIDPRRMTGLTIERHVGNPLEDASELKLTANWRNGIGIYVASNDENWTSQAFGRLYDEVNKGRSPLWATLSSRTVRALIGILSVLVGVVFAVVVGVITSRYSSSLTALIAADIAGSVVGFATWLMGSMNAQLFEILPEGTKPRLSTFFRAVCVTLPSTLLLGVLINLFTQ